MLTSINVKFIFDSVRLGLYSSTKLIADVALRVVLLGVFAMFLAIISPSSSCSSYSCKQVKCLPFLFSQPTQLNLVPWSSRLTVH